MNDQLHCLIEPSTSSCHRLTSTPIVDVGIEDREHEVTTLVAASSSRAATPSSAPPTPSSNPTTLQEAILAVDIATPKHPPATRTNCSMLGRNTGDPILAAQNISLVVPVADPDDSTGVGYNSDNSFHGDSVLAVSRLLVGTPDIFESPAVVFLTRARDREPAAPGELRRAVARGAVHALVTLLPGHGGVLRGAGREAGRVWH